MSLHSSTDITEGPSLPDWKDEETVKKMLKQAENRLMDSMRTRDDPIPPRLNIVHKGSTLDQRFEDLKKEMKEYIDDAVKKAITHIGFASENRIDHHMGRFVQVKLDEMSELIADIRMEWDEFQEDEGR